MALSSMTGFARGHGVSGPYNWTWELKSVNAKGLDVRLRLPVGWDAIEPAVRARAAEQLARGTVYANLSMTREGAPVTVRLNNQVLEAVLATARELKDQITATPPSLDGLLAIKGVLEISDAGDHEDEKTAAEAALAADFAKVLAGLVQMRRREGDALGEILEQRLAEIASLAERADKNPGRRPEAVRARLAEQIAALLENGDRLDPDRLHQEAILIASKADIREELDRLRAHVAQARRLLIEGGAIGRKLDFLAQELNRESNTLCAKSNDIELTNIGLELKSVVEQFREQVQNLE